MPDHRESVGKVLSGKDRQKTPDKVFHQKKTNRNVNQPKEPPEKTGHGWKNPKERARKSPTMPAEPGHGHEERREGEKNRKVPKERKQFDLRKVPITTGKIKSGRQAGQKPEKLKIGGGV